MGGEYFAGLYVAVVDLYQHGPQTAGFETGHSREIPPAFVSFIFNTGIKALVENKVFRLSDDGFESREAGAIVSRQAGYTAPEFAPGNDIDGVTLIDVGDFVCQNPRQFIIT